MEKTCIFLEGFGSEFTSIEWDDHYNTAASPTFTSLADNIVVKGITFKVIIILTITLVAKCFVWE